MIRKPSVRGQFYPSDSKELRRTIESLNPKKTSKIKALGIILPHAGYVYSGKVAVTTVASICPKKKVIILGPNHTGIGGPFSIFPEGEWEMPFGNVKIDSELASSILDVGNIIKEDTSAHTYEHSIEVELPILQYFFGNFKFIPIACSHSTIDEYKKVGKQIFKAIEDMKEEVLLVASNDMSHYEKDATARKKDSFATESIINLDEEELLNRVSRENISMCGASSVSILIHCCKLLKAKKAQVALYQTSGDVNGDYSSVVGYLGVVVN